MKKNGLLVVIISCWVLLFGAFISKLLGADFYPSTENQTFINLCKYIETHNWLKYTIYCVISLLLNSLSILAILGQKFYTKIQLFIFIPLIIIMSLVSWYNQIINIILGVILYLLPIIWLKNRWYRVFIGLGLILLFQVISILIKNIGHWYLNDEYALVTILMQLDSIIMNALYYLYANYYFNKEKK